MRADRLCTATAIIVICGFSVLRGWDIVHFSISLANIGTVEKRAAIANSWSVVPGVAAAALQAELKEQINTSDPTAANRRREALVAILSIEPLSSVNWLSLSGMQLVTDQPMEQVLGSLELSMVTGPNEGYLIVERGILGVSLWESLSPYLKKRVAVDLAKGEIAGNERFRAVVSAQPEPVRNELRAAILATGLLPKEVEQRLGF